MLHGVCEAFDESGQWRRLTDGPGNCVAGLLILEVMSTLMQLQVCNVIFDFVKVICLLDSNPGYFRDASFIKQHEMVLELTGGPPYRSVP